MENLPNCPLWVLGFFVGLGVSGGGLRPFELQPSCEGLQDRESVSQTFPFPFPYPSTTKHPAWQREGLQWKFAGLELSVTRIFWLQAQGISTVWHLMKARTPRYKLRTELNLVFHRQIFGILRTWIKQITKIIISNDEVSGAWAGRPVWKAVDSRPTCKESLVFQQRHQSSSVGKGRSSFQWVILEQLNRNIWDLKKRLLHTKNKN